MWSFFSLKIAKALGLGEGQFRMKHESTVESEMRPDFMFLKKSGPSAFNPYYASFLVELMVKNLDDEHIGKVVLYNEEVLTANPRRKFIISVLTNLEDIRLVKSYPGPDKNGNFDNEIIHFISKKFNFWEHGVKYLKKLYDSPKEAGYDEDLNFFINIPDGYLSCFNN